MTRYVVQPLDDRWVIVDSVTKQPYSAPSASLTVELLFCELVNSVHERLNETARCEVGAYANGYGNLFRVWRDEMSKTITIQLYSNGMLRAFFGNVMLFQILRTTYRDLDDFGIPRVGKKNGWLKRDWGWEIMAEMKFRKHRKSEK